jgi:hypothetical protein
MLAWEWIVEASALVGEQWQLITTWNEWPESTGVEPDLTHGTSFVDTLNQRWGP